jgi:hypothetical protein
VRAADDGGERSRVEPLLEREVAIRGDEHITDAGEAVEQRTVVEIRPPQVADRRGARKL